MALHSSAAVLHAVWADLIDFWFDRRFEEATFQGCFCFIHQFLQDVPIVSDANGVGQAPCLQLLGWRVMPLGVGARLALIRWQLCERGSDHPLYLRSEKKIEN